MGSPGRVRIWFNTAIDPSVSTLTVQTPDGRKVTKGDGFVNPADPTLLEVSVPDLPLGNCLVIWSVMTADGYRTSGDYEFTVK